MIANSLITHLQLKKMSVMYEFAYVAITFQLLEMSSITTPSLTNFEYSHKVHFSKSFFRKNISHFTDMHNKKLFWKFRVNRLVSVTGTHVNVYQIS